MSEPFLTTTVAGMRIAVEVAWGADLTDLDGSSWTWDDITEDVVLTSAKGDTAGISIVIGRPDFSQETQTAEMTCQLDNRQGTYSEGGMSLHWPNVRRGTPVRVRVSDDNGATWSVRFQGNANGFTPTWDAETGRWATVQLSASGPLRKLNQGTLPAKSVYTTEIPRSPGWRGMFLYWPCEGGDGIRNNPTLVPASGKPPLELDFNYFPKAANNPSNAAFPYSGPYQSHFKMQTPDGSIPSYTNTGVIQMRWLCAVPGALPEDQVSGQPLNFIVTSNSTVPFWSLRVYPDGKLNLLGLNSSQTVVKDNGVVSFSMNGKSGLMGVTLDNNGTSLDVRIQFMDMKGDVQTFADDSYSSTNIGTLTGIDGVGPDFSPDGTGTENGLLAHITVQNNADSLDDDNVRDVFLGKIGETVIARITRLCANHNIHLNVLDSTVAQSGTSITETMGPQYYDTLTALLRECELTGQGLLYDGISAGLTYVTKERRAANANGPAALVIDAAQHQMMEPFAPIDDDQLTQNHCDVSVRNGATISYVDADGPVGGNAIGDYATSYGVNPEHDTDLLHYAQWTVGIGTQPGYRYPSVSFALETNPELISGWLDCLPQSRIDVTNVTAIRRQHPTETIKLLLEGWQETIDAFTWRVTANTTSAEPWNVVRLAAATGSTGDGICHLDTDGSQLNANAAAGATSISVRTLGSGPLWVTSSGDSDSFPFDLDIGGCKVAVTAIGAASSKVQTFTLASPGLPRAFTGSTTEGAAAATPVKVWRPPVFGL